MFNAPHTMKEITQKKLEKYLATTEKALKGVEIAKDRDPSDQKTAEEFIDMAKRYYSDADFYKNKGDFVTAFAAVNYAHAWIDAGVRAGFLIAEEDSSEYIMPTE